jgi:hypothetical protein
MEYFYIIYLLNPLINISSAALLNNYRIIVGKEINHLINERRHSATRFRVECANLCDPLDTTLTQHIARVVVPISRVES